MLSIFDFQDLVAGTFFEGNLELAGMVIYTVILLIVFALTRKTAQTLIVSMPVTLVFSALGVLSTDLTVLLIIVTVLGLALTARNVWRD